MIEIICLGDIVGTNAVSAVTKYIYSQQQANIKNNTQFFVVNAENSAEGFGITNVIYDKLIRGGANIITGGNHSWDKKEIYNFVSRASQLVRPYNLPEGCPGKGYQVYTLNNTRLAVINLMGRVFMNFLVDCPFRAADNAIQEIQKNKIADIILVDFHAEATAEKIALGQYLDGRVQGVFGTHTHVATADEQILPNNTAYITDIGACLAQNSIMGMTTESILPKFLTGRPSKTKVSHNKVQINGIKLLLSDNHQVESIERVQFSD